MLLSSLQITNRANQQSGYQSVENQPSCNQSTEEQSAAWTSGPGGADVCNNKMNSDQHPNSTFTGIKKMIKKLEV